VGQGALAIEIRASDTEFAELLLNLHDADNALCVEAERALLRGMGGGCQVPIGALARVEGDNIALDACVCSADGKTVHRLSLRGAKEDALRLGEEAATQFKAKGAGTLVAHAAAEAAGESNALKGARVVLTRTPEASATFREQLCARGAEVFPFPTIAIKTCDTPCEIPAAAECDWVVFTSANAVTSFEEHLQRAGRSLLEYQRCAICAIGPATARALQQKGMIVSLSPEEYNAESLVEAFTVLDGGAKGKHFLLPRGNLARPTLPDALRNAGARMSECAVYETVKPEHTPDEVEALLAFNPNIITFTSSSTAKNFRAYLSQEQIGQLSASCAFVSIGPETSKTLNDLGFAVREEASPSDTEGLVRATMRVWKAQC